MIVDDPLHQDMAGYYRTTISFGEISFPLKFGKEQPTDEQIELAAYNAYGDYLIFMNYGDPNEGRITEL